MRTSAPAPAIRARLQQHDQPDRDGRFPLNVVIEGVGEFPANRIDTVLRELAKVREIIG
jgi:hypothetical protein